eukprot:7938768-Karenia_brevis.AAC.1
MHDNDVLPTLRVYHFQVMMGLGWMAQLHGLQPSMTWDHAGQRRDASDNKSAQFMEPVAPCQRPLR